MIDWRKTFRGLGVALNLRDPPNIPPYGWSYFDHLVAVYVTLNTADVRGDAVIKKSRERPDDLKWGDIYLLEDIIFSLQPPEVLQRNAWIIRERFREITCKDVYDKYIQSGIPKDADTPDKLKLLRADLCRILDVLHWHYSLIPIRERIRKKLTINCILMVVGYTVALGSILFWCHKNDAERSWLAMMASVVYCGVVGGFVSSQRRMQKIPTDTDPLISIFGLDNAGYFLWLSPLLGAIFAVVLTMMFVGGILKGTVFPDFPTSPTTVGNGMTFMNFGRVALPTGAEQYAKLFIWAFLAGFAEQLVPDSLDRLSAKVSSNKHSESPGIPAGLAHTQGVTGANSRIRQEVEVSRDTIDDALRSGEQSGVTGGKIGK